MRAFVVATLVALLPLSGCLDSGAQPSASSESSAPAATTTSSGLDPPAVNAPPIAVLNVSSLNGTAPLNVTFTVDGSDEDGDPVNWSLDADGDNESDANGTTVPATVEFSFASPGNYTAILIVSDGSLEANASLTVVVEAAKLGGTVSASDPSRDSDMTYTDLVKVTFTLNEENLVGVLQLTELWPTNAALTPVQYNLHLNGRIFKSLGRYPQDSAPLTWDTGAGAYMPAGTSKWDSSAKTVTFTIPLTYLADKKVEAPYKMFGSASIGAINTEAKQSDRAPNAGELILG